MPEAEAADLYAMAAYRDLGFPVVSQTVKERYVAAFKTIFTETVESAAQGEAAGDLRFRSVFYRSCMVKEQLDSASELQKVYLTGAYVPAIAEFLGRFQNLVCTGCGEMQGNQEAHTCQGDAPDAMIRDMANLFQLSQVEADHLRELAWKQTSVFRPDSPLFDLLNVFHG
jgi:hypothetical protein